MPQLIVYPGSPDERCVDLDGQQALRLGRAPGNDIVIERRMASRHHAVLEMSEEGWVLRDVGSYNGTELNGRQVESASLQDGDEIRIAGRRIRFVLELPDATMPLPSLDDMDAIDTLEVPLHAAKGTRESGRHPASGRAPAAGSELASGDGSSEPSELAISAEDEALLTGEHEHASRLDDTLLPGDLDAILDSLEQLGTDTPVGSRQQASQADPEVASEPRDDGAAGKLEPAGLDSFADLEPAQIDALGESEQDHDEHATDALAAALDADPEMPQDPGEASGTAPEPHPESLAGQEDEGELEVWDPGLEELADDRHLVRLAVAAVVVALAAAGVLLLLVG